MTNLIEGAEAAVTGFLGGIQGYLIAGGVALVIGLGGGAYAGYRWEKGEVEALKAANVAAMLIATQDAAAKQKRIDDANQADAVDAAYFKGKMDATTIQIALGAPANVTVLQDQQAASADHAGCITYGFVRLLVAGERGVAAESLPIPSGESVDACTAYEPSALATAIAQDLAAGYANGHQLDALIAAVRRNDSILEGNDGAH